MDMLFLMILLVITSPFVIIWRALTGDPYMPPQSRIPREFGCAILAAVPISVCVVILTIRTLILFSGH